MITFVVNNHLAEEKNKKAEAWEKVFIEKMRSFSSPNMTVSFSSEVGFLYNLEIYCTHDCDLLFWGRLCVNIKNYCKFDCVLVCFSAPLRTRLTGRVTRTFWPYSPPTSSCLVISHSRSDSTAIVSTALCPKCWYILKLYLCNVWFCGNHSIPDNVWLAVNCNLWHLFNVSTIYSLWT